MTSRPEPSSPEGGRGGAQTDPVQRPVVLALGGNLGDRIAYLQLGIDVLGSSGLTATAVSGVFETTPVGGPDQDNYLNAVLRTCTAMPAPEILTRCAAAEATAGRIRTAHWGPRTLDVDIITCGTETSSDPDLTLPHPRAHERAFVLAPWLDIDRDAELPGWGRVADLLARMSMSGVWRRPELRLNLPADGQPGTQRVSVTGGSGRSSPGLRS